MVSFFPAWRWSSAMPWRLPLIASETRNAWYLRIFPMLCNTFIFKIDFITIRRGSQPGFLWPLASCLSSNFSSPRWEIWPTGQQKEYYLPLYNKVLGNDNFLLSNFRLTHRDRPSSNLYYLHEPVEFLPYNPGSSSDFDSPLFYGDVPVTTTTVRRNGEVSHQNSLPKLYLEDGLENMVN